MLAIHLIALSLALHLRTSSGFSFTINNAPQQCTDLNISLVGSGQPPYSVVIVPYGLSPLPNIEVRNVIVVPFGDTSTSIPLAYPENSQFVVVVSDSTGFGTGGASVAIQVQPSSNSSCYGNSNAHLPFTFSTTPDNQLTQCTQTRIYWDNGATQGTIQFYGVIPGGQCFPISQGTYSSVPGAGYGFDSTVPVRAGTTIGGDGRGIGTGGWEQMVVKASDSQSCLNLLSPSSTPGILAGVASPTSSSYPTSSHGYPTSSSSGGTGIIDNSGTVSSTNGSSSKSNKDVSKGAIIGGAAGAGLAIIAINILVCFCFILRRHRTSHDSVDLLLQGNTEPLSSGLVPQLYGGEVYGAPDTNTVFSSGQLSYDLRQSTEANTSPSFSQTGLDLTALSPSYEIQHYNSHQSMLFDRTTFPQHSGLPEPGGPGWGSTSGSSRPTSNSSPVLGQLHPVNVIYHGNTGAVNEKGAFPETIGLPPAYSSNIQNTLP